MSRWGVSLVGMLALAVCVGLGLAVFGVVAWLDFLYVLSYMKLVMTVLKYIPQAYLNYLRKSTTGWSVFNVILDFSGGVFSISQILLDSFLSGHWAGILGFLTKLVLGIITLIFDTIFLLQHYHWFPERPGMHVIDIDANMDEKKAASPKDQNQPLSPCDAGSKHED